MELGISAALAALLATFPATAAAFWLAIHRGFRVPRRPETGSPADLGLPFRTVSIPTERGRRLFAWHIPPSGPAGPTSSHMASSHVASSHVVVMHGWGANAEDMLPVAVPLHRAGYGVLLVDARNHGRSDCDSFSSLPRFAEDLARAFDWLESQPQVARGRIALLGHSVGAAAALLTAARHRDPAAVVALASFQHPELVMRRYLEWRRIAYRPFGWLICRYVERVIGHRFDAIAPTASAARIRCPTLVAHGAADATTPAGDAAAIAAALLPGRGTLAILPEVGHDTVDRLDAVMTPVLAFLGAHLPATPSA